MTSQESTPGTQSSTSNGEQSIALLLKLAGERTQPSPAAMLKARTAARGSWQQAVERNRLAVRKQRRSSWFFAGAFAAALVFAVLVISHRASPVAPAEAALIVRVDGAVNRIAQQRPMMAQANSTLMSGETLRTTNGRAALNMKGLSLRIDRNTELLIAGRDDINLLHGRVYVDSEGINNHTLLKIHTTAGVVQHEGTQFQVSASDNVMQVQVREGRVRVALSDSESQVQISAGQTVAVSEGQFGKVENISSNGESWAWASEIAPDLDIEGRPLSEFLAWTAREHGWHLRYASAEMEQAALETRLHGALLTRDVHQQLKNIGLITGTNLQLDKDMLLVTSQTEDK